MADLITGMTEIMDHIKKLEKENKELKEANKMLNSYNEANIKLRQEKEDEIQELEEKITCLESDSHNEVSMAEYEELKEDCEELEANNGKYMEVIMKREAELEKLNKESGMDIIADCVEIDTDNYTVEDIIKVIDDMENNIVKKNVEKLSLEKQVNQQQKWFEEINQLLEAEAEDPSVVVVEEYVKKMKIVDNELSKARKYERFLEYRLDQESIDYLIPDDYEERDFDGSSSEEEG